MDDFVTLEVSKKWLINRLSQHWKFVVGFFFARGGDLLKPLNECGRCAVGQTFCGLFNHDVRFTTFGDAAYLLNNQTTYSDNNADTMRYYSESRYMIQVEKVLAKQQWLNLLSLVWEGNTASANETFYERRFRTVEYVKAHFPKSFQIKIPREMLIEQLPSGVKIAA